MAEPTLEERYNALMATCLDANACPKQADIARALNIRGTSLRDVTRYQLGCFVNRGDPFTPAIRAALMGRPRIRGAVARTLGVDVDAVPDAPTVPES
jgi:hypothetical protein